MSPPWSSDTPTPQSGYPAQISGRALMLVRQQLGMPIQDVIVQCYALAYQQIGQPERAQMVEHLLSGSGCEIWQRLIGRGEIHSANLPPQPGWLCFVGDFLDLEIVNYVTPEMIHTITTDTVIYVRHRNDPEIRGYGEIRL